MPSIRGTHNGRAALLPVAVIEAGRYAQHRRNANSVLSGIKPYTALIDTGASSTMISRRIVDELDLQPVTKIPFQSLDGLIYRPGFLFNIGLYARTNPSPEAPSPISICKKVLTGGLLNAGNSFDVLLGMDIIATWDFAIRRDGSFTIEF